MFVYFFIYETKGLSLEEVDELYHSVSKAWKSKEFVPADDYQRRAAAGELTPKAGGPGADHVEKIGVGMDEKV